MKIYKYNMWKNTYILVNDGLKNKYGDLYIYGDALKNILKENILDALSSVELPHNKDIMVIRILEGGRYYYVYEALSNILHKKPLLGEINIKSRLAYDPEDIVTKVVRDKGICREAAKADYIYIGDTIASGKTMLTLLKRLKSCLKRNVKFILIGFFTYYGLDRIRRWLEKNNYEYMFIAYGALLGLGSNLTDMTIGDKPNYIPREIRRYTERKLGKEIANKICIIGDFTYSAKYINKYIAERVIQLWEIGINSDSEETKKKSMNLIREGLTLLMKNGLDIIGIEKILAEEYSRRLFLVGEKVKLDIVHIENVISLQTLDK